MDEEFDSRAGCEALLREGLEESLKPEVMPTGLLHASAANASGFLLTSLSKTPRIEIPLRAKVCLEAFPIKASANPETDPLPNNLEPSASPEKLPP